MVELLDRVSWSILGVLAFSVVSWAALVSLESLELDRPPALFTEIARATYAGK